MDGTTSTCAGINCDRVNVYIYILWGDLISSAADDESFVNGLRIDNIIICNTYVVIAAAIVVWRFDS